MINTILFKEFVQKEFDTSMLVFYDFGENFQAEIDCLNEDGFLLAIECSPESIKMDKVTKEPVMDFSLYKHYFLNNSDAELFICEIKKSGFLPE